jgi:catalase
LQGRIFSYLVTQLKRLGSTNFTYLPINAPKCPFHHFQQDGHMAFANPKGRVNYEPNSWGGAAGGPRESPEKGFTSFPEEIEGDKRRIRSETFADHYSQARQFYLSQTPVEQGHIVAAFIFELSKVETPAIRARMVSHLLNVDDGLAKKVADGLRLKELPKPAEPARPVVTSLKPSPALSILGNPPGSFKGRKLGVLVSDGVDAGLLKAVQAAFTQEGAVVKLVAPMLGGVEASDGSWVAADEKIDGGPSVVFDAVAVLLSDAGTALLADEATARDFVADAFAHCKFIAYSAAARPLLDKSGAVADSGVIELNVAADAAGFAKTCGQLRFWGREARVKRV